MPTCAVLGCGNYPAKTKGSDIRYYTFPKHEDLRKKWVEACGRDEEFNFDKARICSRHFHVSAFEVSLKHRLLEYHSKAIRNLKEDAVPTENLFEEPNKSTSAEMDSERHKIIEAEARKQILKDLLEAGPSTSTGSSAFASLEVSNPQAIEEVSDIEEILESSALALSEISNPVDEVSDIEDILDSSALALSEVSNPMDEVSYIDNIPESSTLPLSEVSNPKATKEVSDVVNIPGSSALELNKLIEQLRTENNTLRKEKQTLEVALQKVSLELENYKAVLNQHFGPGQIKRLLNPGKNFRWTAQDIASSISLRSVSPKAYRYLRKIGHPLPGLSTLRTWALNFNVNEGILKDVMGLMEVKSETMDLLDKVCILAFDEIYVSTKLSIDVKEQKVVGPHKTCQVAIARGLFSSWKQPVFYKFDCPMTKTILFDIIDGLSAANYLVVGVVSDMGITNQKLWSELNVSHDSNNYFGRPGLDEKIFVFADAPHLLKLMRNHFLDQGFSIDGDLKMAYKITEYHLTLKGTERQKVKPAAQIFSNSLSKAILFCGSQSLLKSDNWKDCGKFLGLMNAWFDILNSRTKYGVHPGVNGFGVDLESQIKVLTETSDLIGKMNVGKHRSLLPFQKGILLTNSSLLHLYFHLKEKYNINYLITYRLNQDVVENFFSYIRGMGATNDHPEPLQIKYRLRWYILGKNSLSFFTANKNTQDDGENCLSSGCFVNTITNADFDNKDPEDDEMIEVCSYIEPEDESDPMEITGSDLVNFNISPYEDLLNSLEENKFSDLITNESLKFVAGYIAYRFKNKYQELDLGVPTKELLSVQAPDWIQVLSRGNLMYPSEQLIEVFRIMDVHFNKIHGKFLCNEERIFEKLVKLVKKDVKYINMKYQLPYEILLCMARTRTFIRLRAINKKISYQNCRTKIEKKLKKVTDVKFK